MEETPIFLSQYPFVVLRLRCHACKRDNAYRIVRIAERLGAGVTLDRVVFELTRACPWQRLRPPRKYEPRCLAYLPDLGKGRPPDLPADVRSGSGSRP